MGQVLGAKSYDYKSAQQVQNYLILRGSLMAQRVPCILRQKPRCAKQEIVGSRRIYGYKENMG